MVFQKMKINIFAVFFVVFFFVEKVFTRNPKYLSGQNNQNLTYIFPFKKYFHDFEHIIYCSVRVERSRLAERDEKGLNYVHFVMRKKTLQPFFGPTPFLLHFKVVIISVKKMIISMKKKLMFPEPKVSPATFCRVFPFHVMFNRSLEVVQVGDAVARVIPTVLKAGCKLTDVLYPVRYNKSSRLPPEYFLNIIGFFYRQVRPHLDLTFENILAHINTVYVLKTRLDVLAVSDAPVLRLKGQMLYVPENDTIIFLCYPSVVSLDDLAR